MGSKTIMMLFILSIAVLGVMNMGETEKKDEKSDVDYVWMNDSGEVETIFTQSEIETLKRILEHIIGRGREIISIREGVLHILKDEPKDDVERVHWIRRNAEAILGCKYPLDKIENVANELEAQKVAIVLHRIHEKYPEDIYLNEKKRLMEEVKDKSPKTNEADKSRLEYLCDQFNKNFRTNPELAGAAMKEFIEGMRNEMTESVRKAKSKVERYRKLQKEFNGIERFGEIESQD